jgi:serine/threonine protein kinase
MSTTTAMNALYEDGIALLNYEGYDTLSFDNMRCAVPFWSKVIISKDQDDEDDLTRNLDDLLLPPLSIRGGLYKCNLWNYCKFERPIGYTAVIKKVKASRLNEMINDLLYHTCNLAGKFIDTKTIWNVENMVYFNRKENRVQQEKYVVKIQKANTIRRMFTGFKEVRMLEQVYYSSWSAINGCDVVPQPILGCPVWDGNTWLYVIIMENVSGVPLSKVNTLGYRLWYRNRYNKHTIIDEVAKVVAAFWALGFAHNDLHLGNVIYDIKTDKVKIIDLESAVKMPNYNVDKLRQKLSSCAVRLGNDEEKQIIDCLVKMYKKYYKTSAISLLYLASKYCQQYQDEDNRLYNTDEHLLPLASILLKK